MSCMLVACGTGEASVDAAGRAVLESGFGDQRARALCEGELGGKQFERGGLSLRAAKDSTIAEAHDLFSRAFGEERARTQFPSPGSTYAALCVFEGDLSGLGSVRDEGHLLMYIEDGSVGGGLLAAW